jgi:drug/metabolite transporter (DMT)-like permease
VAAVLLACLSAALFGAMAVAIRIALRRAPDPEVGALATSSIALALTALIGILSLPPASSLDPGELWPFLLAGVLAPGSSQILFMRAVRDAGAARTAVLMGTAPLFSVAIALVALDEPARAPLLAGAALIVAGGIALAGERVRPADFRRLGVVFALLATVLFAARDNLLRWLVGETDARALVTAPVSMAAGAATIAVYLLATRRGSWARGYRRAARAFLPAGLLFGVSYSALFEAYYRGRVTVVAPLVATESLWGVLFSGLLLRRSELVGRRLVLGAALIVAGGVLIGAWR